MVVSLIGVSSLLLFACLSVLRRRLVLMDEFVADLSPQEVEALEMPTLEEVRAAIDARGPQWMQQALAGCGLK